MTTPLMPRPWRLAKKYSMYQKILRYRYLVQRLASKIISGHIYISKRTAVSSSGCLPPLPGKLALLRPHLHAYWLLHRSQALDKRGKKGTIPPTPHTPRTLNPNLFKMVVPNEELLDQPRTPSRLLDERGRWRAQTTGPVANTIAFLTRSRGSMLLPLLLVRIFWLLGDFRVAPGEKHATDCLQKSRPVFAETNSELGISTLIYREMFWTIIFDTRRVSVEVKKITSPVFPITRPRLSPHPSVSLAGMWSRQRRTR